MSLLRLSPGDYEVKITAPGFTGSVQHVRLAVGQRLSVDATLRSDLQRNRLRYRPRPFNSIPIQPLSRTCAQRKRFTIFRSTAAILPSYWDWARAWFPGSRRWPALFPTRSSVGPTAYAINGQRMTDNRFLLDGIGDNENHNGLGVVIFPPIDAVEEFREQTTDADARYGRAAGGVINLVFKSGTNHYHGEVFEFLRNSALDAKNYFDSGAKPPFRMNTFGATLGGPVFPGKESQDVLLCRLCGPTYESGTDLCEYGARLGSAGCGRLLSVLHKPSTIL